MARIAVVASVVVGVAASSSCLPLLQAGPRGTLWGVLYGSGTGNATAEAANLAITAAGATLRQMSLPWRVVEASPGVVNYQLVAALLEATAHAGETPLFNLAAIDTNVAAVPSDLADVNDSSRLCCGLSWQSPEVVYRYARVVEVLAPLVAYYGGPYFGVANEVDVNLVATGNGGDFVAFTAYMRQFIQNVTSPLLAVGATMTVAGMAAAAAAPSGPPSWMHELVEAVDLVPLTWYPLQSNFSVVTNETDMAAMLQSAVSLLRDDQCIVFQEVGYPSGYCNASSSDGSSEALQAAFYDLLFQALLPAVNTTMNVSVAAPPHGEEGGGNGEEAMTTATVGSVRAVSAFALVDMDASTCANLTRYYNVSEPAFVEYLCTLGLVSANGTAKAALTTLEANLGIVNVTAV